MPSLFSEAARSSEVGFVKPSINYGSVAGSSAKFIGQGLLNIKKPKSFTPPFHVRIINKKIAIDPGTLNGILPDRFLEHAAGVFSAAQGMVAIQANTDGQVVTGFSYSFGSTLIRAVPPTTPLGPKTFQWPIAWVEGNISRGFKIYRLIGPSSLVATLREASRRPVRPSHPADSGWQIYYTWVVSNSTEPMFVTVK